MSNRSQGFVLIVSLWILSILTLMAVSLAFVVRQHINVLSVIQQRVEQNDGMVSVARLVVGRLRLVLSASGGGWTPGVKQQLLNNPQDYATIQEGIIQAKVIKQDDVFGVSDEQSRININTIDQPILARLLMLTTGLNEKDSQRVAGYIIDWRKQGSSQLEGFYSDNAYHRLLTPYPKKDKPFESLNELLLVNGVTLDIYQKLLPFITIYGDGKININSAPVEVLRVLGLGKEVIESILKVRRGKDGIEATLDDWVFTKTFDIVSEIKTIDPAINMDLRSIDHLNAQGMLTTQSGFYRVEFNVFHPKRAMLSVLFIYDARQHQIIFWHEK